MKNNGHCDLCSKETEVNYCKNCGYDLCDTCLQFHTDDYSFELGDGEDE